MFSLFIIWNYLLVIP